MSAKDVEKKGRRSFLKGVAAGGMAAVVGTPLVLAQGQGKGFQIAAPPPGDNAPEDAADELQPLVKAALSEAMAKVDNVIEKTIRNPRATQIDVAATLKAEGLVLRSPGATAAAKRLAVPEILLKKRREGQTKGWHFHQCWVSVPIIGCILHTHKTW